MSDTKLSDEPRMRPPRTANQVTVMIPPRIRQMADRLVDHINAISERAAAERDREPLFITRSTLICELIEAEHKDRFSEHA